MEIDESKAKLLAVNFCRQNYEFAIYANTVLKGNSWHVSVNIVSPKKQVKEILVDAKSGEILGYNKLNKNYLTLEN